MAVVRPFKAVRPSTDFAEKVAAVPYDVLDSNEARKAVIGNPYSFLHIDKAEIDLPAGISPYSPAVYEKALENFKTMLDQKILIQDGEPFFYIYELTMDKRVSTGLVACTSVDEYLEGQIKKHELTRSDKEQDRIRHVDILNANTGPIFLGYKREDAVCIILKDWKLKHSAIYDFTTSDSITHRVWIIDDNDIMEKLKNLFLEVPNLYIADGHHRNASAAKVALNRRKDSPNFNRNDEFNFYLSVIFPDDELFIMEYNRLLKDLNNLSFEEFLKKLEHSFTVSKHNKPFKPSKKGQFGMYIKGCWYALEVKPNILTGNTLDDLDVSILQKEVLSAILGIGDVRSDDRIDFAGGIRGLLELEKRVDSGDMQLAFSMFPTSMSELMEIADSGEIMPPKSTWFEPKLRSGLFIHLLK